MDREKLNEAAGEQANYSTHWSWGDRKKCFISGAEWLMKQPLSERLTEEEKEKIKRLYNKAQKDRYDNSIEGAIKGKVSAVLMTCLTDIFGKDLFNDNPELLK